MEAYSTNILDVQFLIPPSKRHNQELSSIYIRCSTFSQNTLEIPCNEKLEHRSVLCNERQRNPPPNPTCYFAPYMMRTASDAMRIIVCSKKVYEKVICECSTWN